MNKKIIVSIFSLLLLVSCGSDNNEQIIGSSNEIVTESNIDENQLEKKEIENEVFEEQVDENKKEVIKEKILTEEEKEKIEKEKLRLEEEKRIMEEKKRILNYVEGSGYKNITNELKKVDNKYMNTKNFGSCIIESIDECNSDIVRDLMRVEKDITLCDGFITEQQKNNCKNTFITKDAIKTKSFDKCNESKGGDEKIYNCRNEIAIMMIEETSDEKYCDNIKKDEGDKENEIAIKLTVECKNQFIVNEAVKNNDKTICEKILNQNSKRYCIEDIEKSSEDDD